MYNLAEKLVKLEPYEPITGEYKIRLDANENFIEISPEEIAEGLRGIKLNRYPDPFAVEATKAFADFYGLDPDFITAGNGSDELISVITACFLAKGERVLCFAPDFSMYGFYSQIYELNVDVMPKNDDLTIDVDRAIMYANENNIRAILFSNPCNPTSLGLDKKEVEKLIKSVKSLVILDEAYMDFWDNEKQSLLRDIEKYDNLIILRTCSKGLAMAGLRLGFAVSSKLLTGKLRAAKSPYNVNLITQATAAGLLKNKEACSGRIEKLIASTKQLYDMLSEKSFPFFDVIYPTVTDFVFIKTACAREIFEYLLGRSIAIRYMGDYLRITAGTAEENAELVKALSEYEN